VIAFWLPVPPSSNRLWRFDRGRAHVSDAYAEWIKAADDAAKIQGLSKSPVLGRHTLQIRLSERFRGRADLDNRVKAVLDWCQRAHLILDDGDCCKVSIEWADISHDCTVVLTGEIAYRNRAQYRRAVGAAIARWSDALAA
jgi:Holliday junction resolvase RusA-like endonuclease